MLGNRNELKLKLIGLELIHIIDIYIGPIMIGILCAALLNFDTLAEKSGENVLFVKLKVILN